MCVLEIELILKRQEESWNRLNEAKRKIEESERILEEAMRNVEEARKITYKAERKFKIANWLFAIAMIFQFFAMSLSIIAHL